MVVGACLAEISIGSDFGMLNVPAQILRSSHMFDESSSVVHEDGRQNLHKLPWDRV